MLMVTIVKPIAISGEISAIMFDRSARFSSTNCMSRFLSRQTASAHQQAELLPVGIRGRHRFGEAAVEYHCDPISDLGEFIEVLAGHEHGGARCRGVEQRPAGNGGPAPAAAPR